MKKMAKKMARPANKKLTKEEVKVIAASSVGTVFEWYDFYLYGSLAAIIAKQFFTALDPTSAFIFALLAFAAGFVVRPFGALVFGRLGDLVGRKYTFLITIMIMGVSTFMVGVLPSYTSIGIFAPIALIGLRLLQGLALGGEYGGAAIYVAEHAPKHRRGFFTSWIQTTATVGLMVSLLVIMGVRTYLGEEAFAAWGWRIPFLMSIILLAISVYIRLSMNESPAFKKMKAQGRMSKSPLKEAFGKWKNLKWVVLALFGLVAGQAVVWYSGQFYALFFLTKALNISAMDASIMIIIALVIATPFFVIFGSLSDRIGRKPIILTGCLLAALTYFPVFKAMTVAGNPDLAAAQNSAAVTLVANPEECSFQFNPTGTVKFTSSCDIAKQVLARNSVSYDDQDASAGDNAFIKVGDVVIPAYSSSGLSADEASAKNKAFKSSVVGALRDAGYPEKADPDKVNKPVLVVLLTYLVLLATMVYGPIAATLVELFPTRIRYSAMSLPYHIGNGWFGGLLPTISFAIVAQTGNIYNGLWYPIIVAAGTFVIGFFFIPETKDRDIYADD